ncbi:hypothetical protein ACQ4PT_064358 [Festuca glaucescens]
MNDLSAGRSEASHGAPEAPINAFLEGPIEGIEGAGGGEDEEGARSLQGSHLAVCRNWRRFVGLNSPIENEDEQYRDVALGILAVDDPTVVPWASTDSNPTASGGDLEEEEYEREGNRLDEKQLIDKLRELLENERYFIIIDDIWDLKAWEIIKCALLFGGKYKCPKDQPAEVTEKILKKCHGMPLAIITVASLLAGKPMEDWSKVYTSIGFGQGDNTIKILSFSYYDLPCQLWPCLLHLSIFPEDTEIMKDTLIWMWIAEGFVAEQHGVRLFEIGERYFNELMNRSMILPVENSPPISEKNDMVLDMICFLSNEQKFVTILDNNEKYLSSQSNPRRLAVQTKDEEQHNPLANTYIPKLRSCYASMCHISVMPSLSSFQVLRVLDMKGCGSLRDCYLKNLGRLLQLRYLSLEDTRISELPEDIGDLRFLQSLDLKDTKIKELPQSIGLLRKLKRLRADSAHGSISVIAPNWIGNLTSLEELHLNIIGQSIFVKELGKLTELRVLRCVLEWIADAYWQGYEPPRQLRVLISGLAESSSLPAWINSKLLPNLSYLEVKVHLKVQDWLILGSLPDLRYVSRDIPRGMEFSCGSFPNLRRCDITAPFRFFRGSMQSLDCINIYVYLEDANTDFDFVGSLGNLPSLRVVEASICCWRGRASDVEELEAALRRAIDTHPNRPTLELRRIGKVKEEQESHSEQTEQEVYYLLHFLAS